VLIPCFEALCGSRASGIGQGTAKVPLTYNFPANQGEHFGKTQVVTCEATSEGDRKERRD